MRSTAPVTLEQLRTIVSHWADAAMQLSESDLKLMSRLAAAQARLFRNYEDSRTGADSLPRQNELNQDPHLRPDNLYSIELARLARRRQ
jgi:hypothetical protein